MNKSNEDFINSLKFLNFIQENKESGKLSKETSDEIKKLCEDYKLPTIDRECSVITADFGVLGSVAIKNVIFTDKPHKELKYESGGYDYVYVEFIPKYILWTDYKNIEPYNRQSGLYCEGMSFEYLGKPVVENSEYREFVFEGKNIQRISFPMYGYKYNDFYGSVKFDISIKTELVDEFIVKLRAIINK